MFLFKQVKSYFIGSQPTGQEPEKESSDSFEYIVTDILELPPEVSSDHFDVLCDPEFQIKQQEGLQNMYVKDYIHIGQRSEGRELSLNQWQDLIRTSDLSLYPKKDLYFSLLKGIQPSLRLPLWDLLSNTSQMKKNSNKKYYQLIISSTKDPKDTDFINKDVPRSASITKLLPQLRNILIAYVNLSGRSYTQGMNLIAASLLSLMCEMGQGQVQCKQLIGTKKCDQERVFWIFMGIMQWKNWEGVFERDLSGLKNMLEKLNQLLLAHIPKLLQRIVSFEWDLTIFSQFYITILLYNAPRGMAQLILDLFLLDGEGAVHALLIRILALASDKLLSQPDEAQFMLYLRRDLIADSYVRLQRDRLTAKSLDDFALNFIKTSPL